MFFKIFRRKNKNRIDCCPVCCSDVYYNGVKLKLVEKYIPNFKIDDLELIKCSVCHTYLYAVKRRENDKVN